MKRSPTIYDVAREAGVAASTVSRAYSRPGRVKAETARLIFDTAERIGYRTRRLDVRTPDHSDGRGAIGLVIADVTNPFYGEIIKGAHRAARKAGQMLIISHTGESPTFEREAIECRLSQVDGIIIASSRMNDSALRMVIKQKAVVLLNRVLPEACSIVTDNVRGVRRAAEHLAMLGHSGIVYVAGPETSWPNGIRWRTLRESAPDLEMDVRRVGPHEPTVTAGFRAAPRVAKLGATAVLAYNDQIAIGIIKGFRKLGLRVPEDISVVGFDNIIYDETVEPSLTTVAAPLHEMGAMAVRNCIAVARGAQPGTGPSVLPIRLIERRSTSVCRRSRIIAPGIRR